MVRITPGREHGPRPGNAPFSICKMGSFSDLLIEDAEPALEDSVFTVIWPHLSPTRTDSP